MPGLGDMMYAFTEWLRTTPLVELSLWINELPLSLVIQTNFWVIPAIQTVHILAIAGLFSSALMISLRVRGMAGTHLDAAQTMARYAPWIRWSFVVLVISGLLLIIGEPVRELINPVFWVKMVLIVIAVLASLQFNRAVIRNGAAIDSGQASGGLKLMAVLMLLLWCSVMAGGRWIAYAPV